MRAKDVALLFADAATGAHSPALVSQGRIGAVIAAKPAERRAMLEEAAGIAGLHVRRKDAEQKLRATEANLTRLDEVIADQEARAAALRRQARQAERYRELSDADPRRRGADDLRALARRGGRGGCRQGRGGEREDKVALAAEAQRAAAAYQQARDRRAWPTARAAALAARDAASEAGHALAGLRAEHAAAERRLAELADSAARLADDRDARRRAGATTPPRRSRGWRRRRRRSTHAIADDAAARLPALDAALAEAERAARDAEVALAQALAAQAGEAADARVADAARGGGAGAASSARRAISASVDAEARGARRCRAARRRRARRGGEGARRRARRGRDRARRRWRAPMPTSAPRWKRATRAEAARAAARAELAALDSEVARARKATRPRARDRLLDHLRAAPGYERALAAALGDDLEAGLDATAERYWAGAEPQPGDPARRAALTPLGDMSPRPRRWRGGWRRCSSPRATTASRSRSGSGW